MEQQESKQGICNRHGIRIYPVLKYGKYFLEIEYNRSPEWEKRYVIKCTRGTTAYDPKKTEWKDKIEELYQKLYETKVKSKLKRKQNEHQQS